MNRFTLIVALAFAVPVAAQQATVPDPLQARVTIDYRNAQAATVIGALAAATGLTVEIGAGDMRPVTITLTNVKLGTALNAVCENASCAWRLQRTLIVTPVAGEVARSLPDHVSFAVDNAPASDVFRALAAAINVPVTVEPRLSDKPVSLHFASAPTAQVLDMLCDLHRCAWAFDPVRGIRVTSTK